MTFKNYANIFARESYPKRPNRNEFVSFSDTDSSDFSLEGTKLVCQNAGNWNLIAQYQLVNYQTYEDKNGAQLDGWLRINGIDVSDSDATNSVNNVGGVNVLAISVCLSLNVGDEVEWGVRSSSFETKRVVLGIKSYVADTGIVAPSIILTCQKLLNDQGVFKNYANMFSNINAPLRPNHNEVMKINNTDTLDFELNDGKVVAKNPGKWFILSQYQCFAYNTTNLGVQGQVDGWFVLNGSAVSDSDATWSTTLKNEVGVLAIGAVFDLKNGDELELGIRSSSLDNKLNAGAVGFLTPTGIRAPSVILTAFKVQDGANMASFTNAPLRPNENTVLNWDFNDSDNFELNGSQIIAKKSGNYQFAIQYQLYNYANCQTGPNGLLDGFLRLNGVDIPASDATTSSSVLSGVNVLPICAVLELKAGDIVEVGVRASSIDNLLTTACKTYIPPSQIRAPTVILTAFRLP
jgi:hypothetical protein